MDDYELGLLVLLGNVERLLAVRDLPAEYGPLLLRRGRLYLTTLEEECARLRATRLGCLGELQYADEQSLSSRHRAVRAARNRLKFAERLLLRLSRARRALLEHVGVLEGSRH